MSSDFPAQPLISVITPSYNQGRYIRDTLNSVQYQTYRNFEHIVVDGGSTDETVAILKEYPTVQWISEPDHGQADALNKALRLAKGDVIAWINSDDWYAPNTLELVVQALQDAPIAMGRCHVLTEGSDSQYMVPNWGRTWFDLLKYWMAYSIPTQPAIFFRRSILTGLERQEGEVIDPHLHYCMDYDLWIRIAARYPMTTRIDAVTSFYRMSDTNKTSPNRLLSSYAGAEMASVFHRAEAMTGASRQVSFIIYAEEPSDALSHTVHSLLTNSKIDFEIIIAAKKINGAMRGFIEEINGAQDAARNYRFISGLAAAKPDMLTCIADAINRCAGRIISVIPVGAIAATDFGEQLIAAFQDDRIGIVLPFAGRHDLLKLLTSQPIEDPYHADFSFNAFLFSDCPYFAFAVRRATWLEGPGIRGASHPARELKRLVVSHIRQGWHARAQLPALLTFGDPPTPLAPLFSQFTGAELVIESSEIGAQDLFLPVRQGYRLCCPFTDTVVSRARELLSHAPADWLQMNVEKS